MAGLTQERDLILRQGAHAWRVATERGHAVLDGRDVDEEAFRRMFGWWSGPERLHFRSSQETLPFRISERIRELANQFGVVVQGPSDRVTHALERMYPRPATAEDSIRPVYSEDSWEMVWGSFDFEREYAPPGDPSDDSSESSYYVIPNMPAAGSAQGDPLVLLGDPGRRAIPEAAGTSRRRMPTSASSAANQGAARSRLADLKGRVSHLLRRSRLIQRRGGRQEAAAEETDFVLDIRRATTLEGGEDIGQDFEPALRAAGVHALPDLHARPLPRPPSRPRGMRPMPAVRPLPRLPVANSGRGGEMAAIAEETDSGDRDGRDGAVDVERAGGRDGRDLLRILGEVIGELPTSPVQECPRFLGVRSSLGSRSMHRAVERHSIDPSALYLVFEHGELARATGEGASPF
ncbi:hypothetical protein K488DRAFT_75227 [Vararia minispora EC-137]|uniref:Uncharacterized protein n=1 Tax=Vararia minispora EC-137 TaxID=1314806 RepID=A0ACB8Q4B9_9AGAM|nr:hypothetical protein K488DRAFT_75227 [Vararia minispora EC-137]